MLRILVAAAAFSYFFVALQHGSTSVIIVLVTVRIVLFSVIFSQFCIFLAAARFRFQFPFFMDFGKAFLAAPKLSPFWGCVFATPEELRFRVRSFSSFSFFHRYLALLPRIAAHVSL